MEIRVKTSGPEDSIPQVNMVDFRLVLRLGSGLA